MPKAPLTGNSTTASSVGSAVQAAAMNPRNKVVQIKGIGELSVVGVAPAIANVVYHPTVNEVRSQKSEVRS